MVAVLALVASSGCEGFGKPVASPPRTATRTATATPAPTASPTATRLATIHPTTTATATPPPSAVLVGAGDIAHCGSEGDEATAALLDAIDGAVFTLGDNVYPSGTAEEFSACYAPSWGRHIARTRPSPGNHDYESAAALPYFQYFGDAAGRPGEGWYSYDIGGWHVVVLNSVCDAVGGCHAGSPQETWLRADLAAHPADCTLAYWHHPRFSSGEHGGNAAYDAFWRVLYEAGADVVMVGHDHVYERFAPQDPDGVLDRARGIRQFTVGTGGRSLYAFGPPLPTTDKRDNSTFGVLKLTLTPRTYEWEFVPIAGGTFTDTGTGICH